MARINLLPWRVERRKQRQQEFYRWLGLAALAGCALSVLLFLHYNAEISGQNERNDFLRAEITKVDQAIKEIEELDKQKDRLLARKKVIEELQANRSQMVHLFDSLVRTIPDGVVLSNLKQEGDILTLEGRSQSNARVSTYMRNLESAGWMSNPDLSIIEAKAPDAAAVQANPNMALPYVFKLQVKLTQPGAADPNAVDSAAVDAGVTPAVEAAPVDTAAPAAEAPAPAAPAASTPAAAPTAAPADGGVQK